jgi:hypothetical protein
MQGAQSSNIVATTARPPGSSYKYIKGEESKKSYFLDLLIKNSAGYHRIVANGYCNSTDWQAKG